MTTLTATMAALAVLVIFPLLILWRLSLTPQQNARRMRAAGQSFRAIGAALGISHTTARRWCIA